jgi:hypothetical protein
MMSGRDQARQGGRVFCQPIREIPCRLDPSPLAISLDIETCPRVPSLHERNRRHGKFTSTRQFLSCQKLRVVDPDRAGKFLIEHPTPQAQALFDGRSRITNRDRIARLAQHGPTLWFQMCLQACNNLGAGADMTCVNFAQQQSQQLFPPVDFGHQTRTACLSFEFQLPIRPCQIAPPRRIFRIRPAEPGIQHVAHRPPQPRGLPKRRRGMRVMAERTFAEKNRARQGDIYFKPASMGMGGHIKPGSRGHWNSRPQGSNK